MSTRLTPLTKLKIAVPVMYLIGSFILCTLVIFLIEFKISQIIGSLIIFISAILWIIARIQLGDAPNEGRLVTTGLYSELRHPIYYFSTAAFLGYVIVLWIKELLIVWLLLVIFQWVRIHYEEQALAKKLGRRYLRYKERTLL